MHVIIFLEVATEIGLKFVLKCECFSTKTDLHSFDQENKLFSDYMNKRKSSGTLEIWQDVHSTPSINSVIDYRAHMYCSPLRYQYCKGQHHNKNDDGDTLNNPVLN